VVGDTGVPAVVADDAADLITAGFPPLAPWLAHAESAPTDTAAAAMTTRCHRIPVVIG
jgi:hypothetical protein